MIAAQCAGVMQGAMQRAAWEHPSAVLTSAAWGGTQTASTPLPKSWRGITPGIPGSASPEERPRTSAGAASAAAAFAADPVLAEVGDLWDQVWTAPRGSAAAFGEQNCYRLVS